MRPFLVPSVLALLLAACGEESASVTEPVKSSAWRPGDTLIDSRDGVRYPTVHVAGRVWMARNLEFDTLYGSQSFCAGGTAQGCRTAGRLYTWRAAMRADSTIVNWCDVFLPPQGICPAGWHLPSSGEWKDLADSLGGMERLGAILKSRSGWNLRMDGTPGGGIDSLGFSALPGGYRSTGDQGYGWYGHTPPDSAFFGFGTQAGFWTRTNTAPGSCTSAWGMFVTNDQSAGSLYLVPRTTALAVRCVQD